MKTLEITPPGGPGDRILEMGAYLQITPALQNQAGLWRSARLLLRQAGPRRPSHRGHRPRARSFDCDIDLFDAEKDRFPYPDEHFSTVLCGELIEHLFEDPMHLMSEVNRILKPGGHLVLTTPNIASLRGIAAILQGYHPGLFHAYIKPAESGEVDPRHNREYTPREIHQLLENSGFEVTLLETGGFRDAPHPEFGWVLHLLDRYRAGNRSARRWHLRGGPQDRSGARALPRMALLMSAAYLDSRVKLDPVTRAAHVEFEIRNDTSETWRAAEGFAVGYHLFDPRDRHADCGWPARAARRAILRPAIRSALRFDLELPPRRRPLPGASSRPCAKASAGITSAAGRSSCWKPKRKDGAARLESAGIGTQSRLRRAASAYCAVGRALTYPVLTVWRNRSLIRVMVRRDILGRYRGSFGGSFWTIINPLLLMLTYFLVFGVIMHARPGESKTAFRVVLSGGDAALAGLQRGRRPRRPA